MAFDAAIARVTLPATAANLRAATELDEHSDADAWATAVAAMSQAASWGLGADWPNESCCDLCVTNLNILLGLVS